MAAIALLKFTQNSGTAGNGIAMIGVVGSVVTVSNSVNTDVASWQIDLVYTDPSSSIPAATPYAFNDNNGVPTATFTPDVTRSFRWQLKVWSVPNRAGPPSSVDIRVFTVREPNGLIVPPAAVYPQPLPDPQTGAAGNRPNEMNFGGQPFGWAGSAGDGLLNDTLTRVLNKTTRTRYVDVSTTVESGKRDGGQTTPYGGIQAALDEIASASATLHWVVKVAPGSYNGVLYVPANRSITIEGASFDSVKINYDSGLTLNWVNEENGYLCLKNLQVFNTVVTNGGGFGVSVLYMENASSLYVTSESNPLDVIATGPNSIVDNANISGRFAVDGIDHVGDVTCGSFAAYDTMLSGGAIYVTGSTATLCDVQMTPGVSLEMSGYASTLYVDLVTDYWLKATSATVIATDKVVMGSGAELFPSKTIEDTFYALTLADSHTMVCTISASTINVLVPASNDINFPIGTIIYLQQRHLGNIKLYGGDGVALVSRTSLQTTNKYSVICVIKTGESEWSVSGDLLDVLNIYPFSGADNSLSRDQLGYIISINDPDPTEVRVPNNATLTVPVGTQYEFFQEGEGQVSFYPQDGTVQIRTPDTLKLRKQYSRGKIVKIATNVWLLSGDLEPGP